ncbi:MAG TPA: TetR/AcrR family transcriptional regulator [Opitutaceae bacterium]|nr:TetR/AcrR family transcriptional regulator [Opitutaceae bacterium]
MGRTSNADQRLMDAALDLVWEGSYGSVTIDDICQRADVKKGSFYYFFKSKADLEVAALERLWKEQWKPSLDTSFSPSVDPLTRLTTHLGTIYAWHLGIKARYGKVLGCPVCSVGSEVSTQEVDVSAVVRDIMSRKRRYYESAIRDAVAQGVIEPCDPAEEALALFGLIEGLVGQARIMNDPEILRRLPEMALGLLRVKAKGGSPAAEIPVHA